jgi:hypothetical protein
MKGGFVFTILPLEKGESPLGGGGPPENRDFTDFPIPNFLLALTLF